MGSLDSTILASALPTIGRDLGDVHLLPWLITAYLIASTAVTPPARDPHGGLADLRVFAQPFGADLRPRRSWPRRRRADLDGHGVLGDLAAPKDRGRYYSYFSATYTTAGACGPALGGFISDYVQWSAIFWLNIPLGILALWLTSERLRRLPRHERPHRLDVVGAVLIVAASVAFMLGLTLGGSRYPWLSPHLVGAALALGTLFVLRLLTAPEPLIPVSILSNPVVRCALTANTFGWAPIVGLNVFMPTYLQSVLGLSATTAGLSLMVIMVALNTSAGLTGQVIGRVVHFRRLPMLGLVIAIATLLVMGWNTQTLTPWSVAALLAVLGLGFGPVPPVAMVSLQNTVEGPSPRHRGRHVELPAQSLRDHHRRHLRGDRADGIGTGPAARPRRPRPSRRTVRVRVLRRRSESRRFAHRTAAHGGEAVAVQSTGGTWQRCARLICRSATLLPDSEIRPA
jgi:MFS family permease